MDNGEIYRAFVSELEKEIISDAESYRREEERAKEKKDDGQRDRMLRDARFYGKRDHKKTVRTCNDAISALAKVTGQKAITLEPKYCPK